MASSSAAGSASGFAEEGETPETCEADLEARLMMALASFGDIVAQEWNLRMTYDNLSEACGVDLEEELLAERQAREELSGLQQAQAASFAQAESALGAHSVHRQATCCTLPL